MHIVAVEPFTAEGIAARFTVDLGGTTAGVTGALGGVTVTASAKFCVLGTLGVTTACAMMGLAGTLGGIVEGVTAVVTGGVLDDTTTGVTLSLTGTLDGTAEGVTVGATGGALEDTTAGVTISVSGILGSMTADVIVDVTGTMGVT